ncbi:MAG: formate/nitrite transporter family protein [Desulfuromonadales bacterium]
MENRTGEKNDGQARLPENEIHEVRRRTAPRAAIVHEAIRHEGELEFQRSHSALAWSGFAAGLSMGFSLVAEGLLQHHLPDAPWRPLVSKFGYSIGFLIVILGRQQLFTENTLTPILPLLQTPRVGILLQVLRLWLIVLLANLSGAYLFAWGLADSSVFSAGMQREFLLLGTHTLQGDFSTVLISAIYAGWLIALTVWLLPFAETARVMVIIIITYLIGLGGFRHIIAGSVEVFYLVGIGAISFATYLQNFFLPTLLGNIIGGITLVAVINHAQVVAGGDQRK